MSVVFIEGFDLHTRTEDDLPGAMDHNKYWYSPAFNNQNYNPGHLVGQSMRYVSIPQFGLGSAGFSSANQIPEGLSQLRLYFSAGRVGGNSGGTMVPISRITWGTTSFALQADAGGVLRLTQGGTAQGGGTVLATTLQLFTEAWQSFQIYINILTGVVQVRRNGTLLMDATFTPFNPAARPSLGWNRSSQWQLLLDHIVVTDGPSLAQNQVHAIAPSAVFDRYSSAGGFRGNLVINDNGYQTTGDSVNATSLISSSFPNAWTNNSSSAVYWLYPNNPATNQPWSNNPLAELQGWGVCSWNLVGTTSARLTSLGLSIVETMTADHPIIRVIPPSALAYFAGPWVKSHPNLSMNAHVNDIPRDNTNPPDRYLLINDIGCLLFTPTNIEVLETTGITFAEEFREDFVDWARVTGTGEPFESYFITGYSILGEGNKKFQTNYVTVNYENVPVGGAYMQGVWDYAVSGDTGRWGTRQQIYAPVANYKHQMRKLKVRGHGRAMQIKITSEQNKDFRINGWTTLVSGNGTV